MAFLEDKIDEIRDPKLRSAILQEIKKLKSEKKFGLVFEEHLPELAPIYSASIRPGAIVARKTGSLAETYTVTAIQNGIAALMKDADGSEIELALAELVAVKRFGEAIYPALIPLDRVETDPEAPCHTLIEADNYHALQLLEYAYAGKVDVIYIDPPYNTGARDWKYNNRYVDSSDSWQHSKWLAFMRRRLELAKRLLNPNDSVLIVTVDENEVLHLGVLLDQIFPKCKIQMTTIVINPKGTARYNEFSRVEEYAFFVFLGDIRIQSIGSDMLTARDYSSETHVRWRGLARTGRKGLRSNNPGSWYPIFLNKKTFSIHSIGDAIGIEEAESDVDAPAGTIAVWPPSKGNSQYSWGTVPSTLRSIHAKGGLKTGRINPEKRAFPFYYLSAGLFEKIDKGDIIVTGRGQYNELVVEYAAGLKSAAPRSVWNRVSHDAGSHGTSLLQKIVPSGAFPFPKSLYAVRDSLRLFTAHKPRALILDFFAGSGTTLHATLILNAAHGGSRQCILVTNNEVSEEEVNRLSAQGHQPNDPVWEARGICRSVTFPRCKYVIQGQRDDGTELEGEYLTGRTLTKEKPRTFRKIGFVHPASLTDAARKRELVSLIEGIPQNAVGDDTAFFVSAQHTASILFNPSQAGAYLESLDGQEHITHFYLVTPTNKTFNDLKQAITDLLGPLQAPEDEKLPMKNGFTANLEYFKLEFLDPHEVEMGRQFAAILPILWLMAGAKGPRPYSTGDIPYLIPAGNPFAVLLDENHFRPFKALIEPRPDLTHIFLVTDSEDAFFDMKVEIDAPNVIMLYKSYLQNFKINTQRP